MSYQTVQDSQYTNPISTNQICIKLTDGKIDVGYSAEGLTYTNDFTDPMYIYYDPVNYKLSLMSTESLYELNYVSLSPYQTPTWSEFETTVKNQFIGDYNWDGEYGQGGYHYRVQSVPANTTGGETFSEAVRSSNAAQDALHFFSGEPNATFTTYSFVTEDKYALYTAYLNQELQSNSSVIMGSGPECASTLDAAKGATGYAVRNGAQWCALHGVESGGSYNIIENRLNNKLVAGTFKDVVNELMSLNYDRLEEAGVDIGELEGGAINGGADTNDPGSDPDGGENAATPTCFNSAGSLGWILCPVLEIMSSAINGIYDNVVASQFLEVESSLMDTSSSVYQGWQDFRNFANIIFAIMFIVVIFCQVTGVGISNYNIKKILPRLIMTVILVNISFILCQLAVDLSNILGYQLKKIFVDLAGETVVTVGGFVGNLGSALVSTGLTGLAIAGGVYAAAITWEFWLIPLLLFLLGVIISIIFFAIILGVRKAGVLILIVLAPVAIVCYSLPNTKKFFDRWFKMLSSLLLVFPICGLLMGGGQYASTLLLGAAGGDDVGFFMALVAMLVQVVPFFFIPALVKSSMAAMGNLGMKISSMGSRVSSGLQRGIRGSEGVREAERRLGMRNAERSFNRLDKKIKQRESDGRRVSSGLRHRRSSAAARYNRMAYEDIRAGGTQELLSEGSAAYENAAQGARVEQLNKDISARESLYTNDPKFSEMSALGDEYEDVLSQYIASPDDRDLEVKVKALQNILSETDAGREQVQNHMISAMLANSASLTNGTESGLSKAAAHLSAGKLGATYKAKNRSMYNMLGDLSRKQYDMGTQEMRDASGNAIMDPTTGQARRHSFQQVTTTDSQGNSTTSYRSSYYDKSGLSSYTAETLAGADEGAIDRIMDGISSGNIEGNNLQDIAKTASEALNSDTVRVQPKIAKKLRQIERAGFAASHTAIAGASDASLGDVVGRIQTGEINNNNGSTELTRIAQSAQAALRDQTALHSPETAERLNQILSAAAAQGAIDPTTHSHFREVDAASIKVRGRETPKLRQKAPVPQGWTESGIWTGGGTGPTKQQQIAYEQWARDAADVDLHNARINHPPTPPNP